MCVNYPRILAPGVHIQCNWATRYFYFSSAREKIGLLNYDIIKQTANKTKQQLFKWGPLIRVCLEIRKAIHGRTSASKFSASAQRRHYVNAAEIGKKFVRGFFAVGHLTVKKKLVSVKLGQIRLVSGFFWTANCFLFLFFGRLNPRAEKCTSMQPRLGKITLAGRDSVSRHIGGTIERLLDTMVPFI